MRGATTVALALIYTHCMLSLSLPSKTSAGGTRTEQRQAAVPSNGEVTIGPPYTTQPALTAQGAQRGTTFVVQWNMTSARTFNGTSPTFDGAECSGPRPGECCHKTMACAVRWIRNISVYIPPQILDRPGIFNAACSSVGDARWSELLR
eukprot:m.15329 g.15329  ORF g.15329 m.15329 type:complete len:149 (-) comp8631_c0_seq2:801-1247(-)